MLLHFMVSAQRALGWFNTSGGRFQSKRRVLWGWMKAADIDSKKIVFALLGIVLAAQLAPVWRLKFFPTQDGPAHLENAKILSELLLHRGSSRGGVFEVNPEPVPNWTGHLLLAGLMTMASPAVAQKILVTIYIVGLIAEVAYAGRAVRAGGEWVAILVGPLIGSLALHRGLYNFCLSLVLFFAVVGYVIRYGAQLRWRRAVTLLVLVIVLYFSHVVSLLMALAVVGAIGAGWIILQTNRRTMLRQVWPVLLAVAPAMALTVWFFVTHRGEATEPRALDVQLTGFFELDAIVSYQKAELLIAIGYSAVLWLFTLVVLARKAWLRDWHRWDGLLLVVAATLLVYVLTPNSAAGGGQISFRLSLYPYFVLILWIAAQRVARWQSAIVACVAVIVVSGLVAVRWNSMKKLDRLLTEYVSVGEHIPAGSSVAAIDLSRDSKTERAMSWRVRPFWHALGYVTAQRDVVDWGNYEVGMGYFPVVFRGTYAMSRSGHNLSDDERLALSQENVVVWQAEPGVGALSAAAAERLHRGYALVYRSAGGRAVLYRMRHEQ